MKGSSLQGQFAFLPSGGITVDTNKEKVPVFSLLVDIIKVIFVLEQRLTGFWKVDFIEQTLKTFSQSQNRATMTVSPIHCCRPVIPMLFLLIIFCQKFTQNKKMQKMEFIEQRLKTSLYTLTLFVSFILQEVLPLP